MAELVDALDSKSSSREGVRVRPPLRVPLPEHHFFTGMAYHHPQRARVRFTRSAGYPQSLHPQYGGDIRNGGNVSGKP